ncbi:thioredoxin family protein [Treponema sp. OMZ 840]|uniref:thioredoxin family protein n=1 Tax=Treponema sp. OMZ 840 TaxID=244313 RepID=UPI003D8E2941
MFLFGKKENDMFYNSQDDFSKNTSSVSFSEAEDFIRENSCGVKILGTNDSLCSAIKEKVDAAFVQNGSEERALHIDDLNIIAAYGVIHLPALVIDGKVVCTGRVPEKTEIASFIKKRR